VKGYADIKERAVERWRQVVAAGIVEDEPAVPAPT
jgi:hypothetical protein